MSQNCFVPGLEVTKSLITLRDICQGHAGGTRDPAIMSFKILVFYRRKPVVFYGCVKALTWNNIQQQQPITWVMRPHLLSSLMNDLCVCVTCKMVMDQLRFNFNS